MVHNYGVLRIDITLKHPVLSLGDKGRFQNGPLQLNKL